MSEQNDLHLLPKDLFLPLALGRISEEAARQCVASAGKVEIDIGDTLTLLHQCATHGCVAAARYLLEQGHQTEIKTRGFSSLQLLYDLTGVSVVGETPLDQAVWRNQIDVVMLLLKFGADVNCQTDMKYSPLHRCAFYGHERLASLLAMAGADLTLIDKDGQTPYDVALEKGNTTIARVLNPKCNCMYARANPTHPEHKPEMRRSLFKLYDLEAKLGPKS